MPIPSVKLKAYIDRTGPSPILRAETSVNGARVASMVMPLDDRTWARELLSILADWHERSEVSEIEPAVFEELSR